MRPLTQQRHELTIPPFGPGLVEITREVGAWLASIAACDGLLTVLLRTSKATLAIRDSSDPDLKASVLNALRPARRLEAGPIGKLGSARGRSISSRFQLGSCCLSIPVFGGAMAIGAPQGLFLIEHRHRDSDRLLALQFVGSCG